MASEHTYRQGHSESTLATHLLRSAEVDAAFLLPHLKATDHILDVGCGPGTITVGFTKYASEGKVVGVDLSSEVLEKARAIASKGGHGKCSITFEQGNILERLPFPNDSFDVVYASQLFGHLHLPEKPLQALAEIRRVMKPKGILAIRDGGLAQHFFPASSGLDRLWVKNFQRIVQGPDQPDSTASLMPSLVRRAGFDNVKVGVNSTVWSGQEQRQFLANRGIAQLQKGDSFHQSWLDAGITQAEIDETVAAVERWRDSEDGWYVTVQCELVAWKEEGGQPRTQS